MALNSLLCADVPLRTCTLTLFDMLGHLSAWHRASGVSPVQLDDSWDIVCRV